MKNWRINLILIFIILFGVVIIGRLFFLQVIQHDFYAALAKGQQQFFINFEGDRGDIFFQNYDLPIATDKTFPLVYVSPNEIPPEKKEKTAEILGSILDLDKDFILKRLKRNSLYELIKNRLSDEEVEKLKEVNLEGVYLGKERGRFYPQGKFASHILGFVNRDGQGQYGIEEFWQEDLAGKEKFLEGKRGPFGYFFSWGEKELRGSDLTLTVDYNIQYQAEKLLKEAQKDFKFDRGTIIVMEPYSGKILALANLPNFNPNKFWEEEDFSIFKNNAIQRVFEPGSVLKPIIMAAALNEGKITPHTKFLDQGFVKIGDRIIRNYGRRVWGEQTMIGVLEKSINTGAIFVKNQIGNDLFLEYLERFGFFEPTQIDLSGEVFSENRNLRPGSPEINFATATFGQGIVVTPIQLARAFAAIANGGNLVRPYLVKEINGKEINRNGKERIISFKTASQLTAMLVRTVEHLFTRRAQIPGYYVAGKTGTAQIPWAALGYSRPGYSEKTIHTFVGFAPAFDPQFLILVKFDNPQGVRTASLSAAPVFRELASYIINYWRIPPDYELE